MKNKISLERPAHFKKIMAAGLLVAVAIGGATLILSHEKSEMASQSVISLTDASPKAKVSTEDKKSLNADEIKKEHKDLSSVADLVGLAGRYRLTDSKDNDASCGAAGSEATVVAEYSSNPSVSLLGGSIVFMNLNKGQDVQEPYPQDVDQQGYVRVTTMDASSLKEAKTLVFREAMSMHGKKASDTVMTLALQNGTLKYSAVKKVDSRLTQEPAFSTNCEWTRLP